MFRLKKIFLIFLIINISSCKTLLTKTDYSPSTKSLKEWDIQGAINRFPKGESGSFITTMEKTYLNLLSGNPDFDDLIEYADDIDNQVRVKASRELKSFFYIETPEGYYASEHEIIWMHLLLSWGYSMRGDSENACVEAKKSSDLIGRDWSEEGRFDDPLMRVILAAMWAMCGEWEEARVDFRAANKLDRSIKWAGSLAEMDSPPENLIIILGGTGQEPEWDPSLESNPFRGFRGIKFSPQGVRSALMMKGADGKTYPLEITPDSSDWYRRHFVRDNEIQDIIQDSTYAQKATASALRGTAVTLAGVTTGILIAAGGIALGGAVIVLGLYAESFKLALCGIVPIAWGCRWGYNVAKKSYKYSMRKSKKDLDVSRTYRFVRFLPEYGWVGWSVGKMKEPVIVYRKGKPILSSNDFAVKSRVNIVSAGFYPDTINVRDADRVRESLGRAQ